MRCRPEMMRLYAVTDRAWTKKKSLIEQVEEAICGGATCIQLREKNLDEEAFLREAIEMQKLCETYQVPLIINDHVEIAKHCKAAGVHLGQKDMEADRSKCGQPVVDPRKREARQAQEYLSRQFRSPTTQTLTNAGNTVLELFAGSGTTLFAYENLRKDYIGFAPPKKLSIMSIAL